MPNTLEIKELINALMEQMSENQLLPAASATWRLDQVLQRLDNESFLRLRSLPSFWEFLAVFEFQPSGLPAVKSRPNDLLSNSNDEVAPDAEQPQIRGVEPLQLPHPLTKIRNAHLDRPYDKLILRLQRSAARSPGVLKPIESIADILNLSEESLFKLEGIGKVYRDDWYALKTLYINSQTPYPPTVQEKAKLIEPEYRVQEDMVLNLNHLDDVERKTIAKLERELGAVKIQSILNFSRMDQKSSKSWGLSSANRLLQVRQKIIKELELIADGALDYRTDQSSLITAKRHSFESIAGLGDYILSRLDSYLSRLDETHQLIFQHRWGFVDRRLTLAEIGEMFNLSRERIRQLEKKINEQLSSCLSLDSEEVWQVAQGLTHEELQLEMEDLYVCFTEQTYFHEFLSFVSHGNMVAPTNTMLSPQVLLDDYFALKGTAVSEREVVQYLQKTIDGSLKDARNVLLQLQIEGLVSLSKEHVRPLRLKKHHAAAAVLSEHPNGLPWLDVARYANIRGICTSPFSEQASGNAMHDSQLMYVSGKGVYRHTRFIDFANIDEDIIFSSLDKYFADLGREFSHLSEIYSYSSALREYDYYIVRYIVKMRGENRGIYFNGKSQTDSISLNPDFELYSQKSVIIEAMERKQSPMTNAEVAQLLKSRSQKHASFYLQELILTNQVVQVDRMLYTTADLAYKTTDLGDLLQSIQMVLEGHGKPVDPSILQKELNLLYGTTYSKYFYGSVARYFAQQEYLHRKQNLFATQAIPFSSLTNAIDELCAVEDGIEICTEILRQHISITDEAARTSIYNWKAAKARSPSSHVLEEEDDFDR